MKELLPNLKLTRTRCEDRGIAAGVQPIAFMVSHSLVQALAALPSENWPELVAAASKGEHGRIDPSAIIRSGRYPASVAVAVGHDEQPSPAVASACFSRREQARFCAVAQFAKACRDFGKSQIEVPLDVLCEDDARPRLIDDPGDLGPQVPGIVFAAALAGAAEWLAGITGREDMNAAAPRSAIEGSQVIPDKRAIQGRVFHPRHESGRSMGLPLDETNSPVSGLGDGNAKVEPAISGTQRDAAQFADIMGM